jgi:hypothetical protein
VLISPSALIGNISWVLDHEIAPAVDDQPWLSSYLRSIKGLLSFLEALLEQEAATLDADNTDARQTLAGLAENGVITEDIEQVLAGFEDESAQLSMADLRAENLAYQALLDKAIPLLHEPDRTEDLTPVRAYLLRSLDRWRPIYAALGSTPF